MFVTTGEAPGVNALGRLYSLHLHPGNVTKGGTLTVVYNADAVVAAGGDTAISPDNVDTSGEYLMINEDGTASSRPVMAAKGRDGSIWRFDISASGVDFSSRVRVAQLEPARSRRRRCRRRHLGDERDHRRVVDLRSGHVDLGRAGPCADSSARRRDGDRRGRPALPAPANDLTLGQT